jgi:hypothetical protein
MLQRSLLTNTDGVVGTVSSSAPSLRFARAARWTLAAICASAFTGCASMQAGGALGSLRYSSMAPAGATGQLRIAGGAAASTTAAVSRPVGANIVVRDSTLAATIARLRRMSTSFDSAMVALENSGIPVVIGTEQQLRDQLPRGYAQVGGWQALTAFYPLTPTNAPGKTIEHISVIVRLSDLQSAFRDASRSGEDTVLFNRYLERVLAHEIYGHTMPQLAFGKTAPIACDDPTSAEDWYSACVMQRERHVAAQLVEARGTYAALGLTPPPAPRPASAGPAPRQ